MLPNSLVAVSPSNLLPIGSLLKDIPAADWFVVVTLPNCDLGKPTSGLGSNNASASFGITGVSCGCLDS